MQEVPFPWLLLIIHPYIRYYLVLFPIRSTTWCIITNSISNVLRRAADAVGSNALRRAADAVGSNALRRAVDAVGIFLTRIILIPRDKRRLRSRHLRLSY